MTMIKEVEEPNSSNKEEIETVANGVSLKRKLAEVEIEEKAIKTENESETISAPKKKKKKKKKKTINANSSTSVETVSGVDENCPESKESVVKNEDQQVGKENGDGQSGKKKKKKKKKKKNRVANSTNAVQSENETNENPKESNKVELEKLNQQIENKDGIGHEGKKKKKRKPKKKKATPLIEDNASLTCNVLEREPFSNLQDVLSEETMKAIVSFGFTKMTPIQAKAIPPLLEGKDVRGTAKTGSGKTLAFIIPTVERLCSLKYTPADGTGALIISPTRELSLQTYNVLNKFIKTHSLTSGLIMGGVNQNQEIELLTKGINILVATPGRLLHHLQNTPALVIKKLICLVIDEADCILDVGFEEEMNKIIALLPKEKQTIFFSATKDNKVNLLARLSLNSQPIEVEDTSIQKVATVDGLEQAYVLCSTEKKFLILHNFLEKNKKKKVMVFFTTCNAVNFYHGLLTTLGMEIMHIHGKQKQETRTETFYNFCKADFSVLLTTDVAGRGWDIPSVDWIVQYDPPEEPKEYIHRVGRTARAGGNGKALLFIRPEDQVLLDHLEKHNVPVKCENITWNKMIDLQLRVEKIVSNNSGLKTLALVALFSYLRAYIDCRRKDIYSIKKIDVKKLAKCLGFDKPPALPKKLQSEVDEILPPNPEPMQYNNYWSSNQQSFHQKPFNGRNENGKQFFKSGKKGSFTAPEVVTNNVSSETKKSRKREVKKKSGVDSSKEKHAFKTNKVIKAKDKLKMKK